MAGHPAESGVELRTPPYTVMPGTSPGMTKKKQKAGSDPGLFLIVIPGRALSREPGIQSRAQSWIPGLRARARIPE